MKIAMSSYLGLGAWIALRLLMEGHDVDYYLSDSKYEDVLSGLLPKPKLLSLDHRRTVRGYGYPNYQNYDLSLFDLTGRAKQADASRAVCPTIGDGSFEHMLEDDREAGIQCMESVGIRVPPYQRFSTPAEATAFVKKEGKRYVFKPFTVGSEAQDTATTYVAKDADDLIKNLPVLFEASKHAPFILQEFIKGTEASVAGYFNGSEFYQVTCTLEDKKFMNDDKGPNTGCAGNLVFALSKESRLYEEGLAKATPMLQSVGFTGIIDLNTIVTMERSYGLEWTPRFGYLGDITNSIMYGSGYGDFLASIGAGKIPETKWEALYGMSVTLSIPPYPTEIKIPKMRGIPIEGICPEDCEMLSRVYLYDAMLSKDKKSLVTSGNYGYVCAPTGIGDSPEAAAASCNSLIERIHIPNMQYRTDTYKSTMKRYQFLDDNNWL